MRVRLLGHSRSRAWPTTSSRSAGATGAEGTDPLSRLLAARDPDSGERLSDAEVRDEVLIFLVAGHETTGSALAFTLHLLGRHEDVQERVRAEAADASPGAAW